MGTRDQWRTEGTVSHAQKYGNQKRQPEDKNNSSQFSSQRPVLRFLKSQNLSSLPVIDDRHSQRGNTETNHRRSEFTGTEVRFSLKRDFLRQILKEFVNRETKTD